MAKTKATRVASVQFQPWAECNGANEETPCPASWSVDSGPTTRELAKRHAELYPGHGVRVVTETVDLYRAEKKP